MPSLNQNHTFAIPEKMPLNITRRRNELLWLYKMSKLLVRLRDSKNSFLTSLSIYSFLQSHVSGVIRYNGRAELINDLKYLYAILQHHAVPKLRKQQIAHSITCDLDTCAPGFHNRIKLIIKSLYEPLSLSEITVSYREELIQTIARRYSDNTHHVNNVFTVASAENYGVSLENTKDKYAVLSSEGRHKISILLKIKFPARYTIFGILNYILDYLKCIIEDYGYQGRRVSGYEYNDHSKILDKLKTYLKSMDDTELTAYDLFLYTDDYVVHDVNWQSIAVLVLQNICLSGEFNLDQNEQNLLDMMQYCFLDGEISSIVKKLPPDFYSIFVNHKDFIAFLNVTKLIGRDNSEDLQYSLLYQYFVYKKLHIEDILSICCNIDENRALRLVDYFAAHQPFKFVINMELFVKILKISCAQLRQSMFSLIDASFLRTLPMIDLIKHLSMVSSRSQHSILNFIGYVNIKEKVVASNSYLALSMVLSKSLNTRLVMLFSGEELLQQVQSYSHLSSLMRCLNADGQTHLLTALGQQWFVNNSNGFHHFMRLLSVVEPTVVGVMLDLVRDELVIKKYKNLLNLNTQMQKDHIPVLVQEQVLKHSVSSKLQQLNPGKTGKVLHFLRHDMTTKVCDVFTQKQGHRLFNC